MENQAPYGGTPQLTYGEKLVGITFNPGGNEEVNATKAAFAKEIDRLNDFRNREDATPEQKRHASIAITEIQGAQMWAVKALTFPY
jgi:hypothetical protein